MGIYETKNWFHHFIALMFDSIAPQVWLEQQVKLPPQPACHLFYLLTDLFIFFCIKTVNCYSLGFSKNYPNL